MVCHPRHLAREKTFEQFCLGLLGFIFPPFEDRGGAGGARFIFDCQQALILAVSSDYFLTLLALQSSCFSLCPSLWFDAKSDPLTPSGVESFGLPAELFCCSADPWCGDQLLLLWPERQSYLFGAFFAIFEASLRRLHRSS